MIERTRSMFFLVATGGTVGGPGTEAEADTGAVDEEEVDGCAVESVVVFAPDPDGASAADDGGGIGRTTFGSWSEGVAVVVVGAEKSDAGGSSPLWLRM